MSRFSPVRLAAAAGIHYGWVIVGVTFFILLASAGVRSAPGVLIEPLEQDFGWSRGEISWALAVSLVTLGLAGPASGWAINRFGLYRSVLAFLVIGAVGVALTAVMDGILELYIFWGLLVGFGTGGVSTVLGATIANTWFETRRGLVTGVLSGAASAGLFILLFPLLAAEQGWGWRGAIWVMAILLFAVILPLAAWLLRGRPADVGLRRFGETTGAGGTVEDTRQTSLREAMRTHEFWLLAGSFFVCGFTTTGLVGFHFIPHAGEHGFSKPQASTIVTIMGVMNIIGTLASGWLTDRYSPRKLLAVYYFLRAGSLFFLPLITTLPLMSLFAVVFGLDFIATVPPTVMLTAQRFGRRSVPVLFGWITCSHMIGAAIAAALAGQIHDVAGDYAIPIYLSGFLALIAAGMAFNIRPRERASPQPAILGPQY